MGETENSKPDVSVADERESSAPADAGTGGAEPGKKPRRKLFGGKRGGETDAVPKRKVGEKRKWKIARKKWTLKK